MGWGYDRATRTPSAPDALLGYESSMICRAFFSAAFAAVLEQQVQHRHQDQSEPRAIESYLRTAAEGTMPILGGDGIVEELGDGSAALRPSVHLLSESADVQRAAIELAFPCVVSPWSPDDGIEPLQNTLNLVLMGEEGELIDQTLDDPSIRNVYVGEVPSFFSRPQMPHDNYPAGFLMRSKGFVRTQ